MYGFASYAVSMFSFLHFYVIFVFFVVIFSTVFSSKRHFSLAVRGPGFVNKRYLLRLALL